MSSPSEKQEYNFQTLKVSEFMTVSDFKNKQIELGSDEKMYYVDVKDGEDRILIIREKENDRFKPLEYIELQSVIESSRGHNGTKCFDDLPTKSETQRVFLDVKHGDRYIIYTKHVLYILQKEHHYEDVKLGYSLWYEWDLMELML